MDTDGLTVTEHAEPEAWAALRAEWRALLDRSAAATVYQTWEWNEAWWRVFGRKRRLLLACIREAGRLRAVAPLYVSRHLKTPLRRLAFVGTGAADYLDIVAEDGYAGPAARALVAHLVRSRCFDLADLQQLTPASALRLAADEPAERWPHRTRITAVEQEPCPYVRLPDTWAAYTASLGKKMRSNLGYHDRLLARTFDDLRTGLAGDDERNEAMEALFALHQRRWNARMLPGVLGGKKTQAFHRLVADRFAEQGWLRLHCIRARGAVVAVLYCYQYRGRVYYYLGGFEPELARYSLGTVLTASAMQRAILEGCTEFDFLRGHEPYKYRWQPQERVNARVLLWRTGSLRGGALLRVNRLERYVENRAKAFAESRGRKRQS